MSEKDRELSAQRSWSLYNLLILFRVCICPLLTGYIHPDEFFQGGQELWFGCPPSRTWEFEPLHALRSVVPPTVMTWLPLSWCAQILGVEMDTLAGWYVLIIPRVACAILSIIAVDGSIWVLSSENNVKSKTKHSGSGVPIAVLMLASAWPTMVLLNRPFTNAMETWILALLFRMIAGPGKQGFQSHSSLTFMSCLAIGALSAIGIFTRFTFVFFAFPIIIYLGIRMVKELRFIERFVKAGVVYFAFLFVAGEIVHLDSEFYQSGGPVLTPWNALSYNSKVENLQEHGIHPRWTHALVNMFMLYGPMALMAYVSFGMSKKWMNHGDRSQNKDGSDKTETMHVLCKLIVLSGLGVLSMAPHQEQRFLLPLIFPLALLSNNSLMRGPHGRWIVNLWAVFNGALLLLFGIFHQSGVVPSLLAMGSDATILNTSPDMVVFYHTYMPPTFLSRTDKGCQKTDFLDLDGSHDIPSLASILSNVLRCGRGDEHERTVHLVSSRFIFEDGDGNSWYLGDQECAAPGFDCTGIWDYSPHLSLEDPPTFKDVLLARLPLAIHEISCTNRSDD